MARDYEKFFDKAGIASNEDKTAVLDYIKNLFEIAVEVIIKKDN